MSFAERETASSLATASALGVSSSDGGSGNKRTVIATAQPPKDYTVYLVRCRDGSLYCGITKCLKDRIEKHNAGKGSRYTRALRPVTLCTSRDGLTHAEALRVEWRVKQLRTQEEKIRAVEGDILPYLLGGGTVRIVVGCFQDGCLILSCGHVVKSSDGVLLPGSPLRCIQCTRYQR